MACREIQSWTFKGLVAAFVDLSVAFLLLCASSLVYLSSKFLCLFGLSLPCPCDGLFSNPSKNKCFQEVLGHQSVKRIASVQCSVKNRTPFESILCEEQNHGYMKKERKKGYGENFDSLVLEKGLGDLMGEEDGSCNENVSGLDLLWLQSLKKGSYRMKGKGYTVSRSPSGLMYRRRVSFGRKKFPRSFRSFGESINHIEDKDSPIISSEDCGKAMENNLLRKSVSFAPGGYENGARSKQPERTSSWVEEGACSLPFDGNSHKKIRVLEQELEEVRVAHAALALELEKERNAAATAADEAMAMILRLQEEKASIEMEARQNQRMIEEKSAFDAEEMSILKEILLRREKEKHFLEKEVESYRQMIIDIEEPKSSFQDAKSTEFVEQTLRPLKLSFDENGNMETADFGFISNHTETTVPRYNCDADFSISGEESPNQSTVEDLHIHSKIKTFVDEEQKEREEGEARSSDLETIVQCSFDKKGGEESYDVDCRVHDVHVIMDEDTMSEKEQVNVPSAYATAPEPVSSEVKLDRSKSVSETTYKLPPVCPPRQQKISPDMRRKSMSCVDYERFKIENEVGWLWGRLMAVQQGREKLSNSIGGRKEQSKTQLQFHEDVNGEFHDMKKSTEAKRSASQMAKVMSKKRPCRSASLDQHSA